MSSGETGLPPGFVGGNHFDKYRSRNPVHRVLVGGFLRAARELARLAGPGRVLEVGCGPGDLAAGLFGQAGGEGPVDYVGLDLSADEVTKARKRYPGRAFLTGTAYDLPFPDGAFDLVVVCEVLEHLDRPAAGVREAARVCRVGGHVLASVPWEPVWRGLNLARGRYWSRLGDTPGHVQHFSRRRFRDMVGSFLIPVAERRPFPWTMLLGRR